MQYGPNWRKMNQYIKKYSDMFLCEVCGEPNVTLHHIIWATQRERLIEYSDNPRFWKLLCKTCHWYTSRWPNQPHQRDRLIEVGLI